MKITFATFFPRMALHRMVRTRNCCQSTHYNFLDERVIAMRLIEDGTRATWTYSFSSKWIVRSTRALLAHTITASASVNISRLMGAITLCYFALKQSK